VERVIPCLCGRGNAAELTDDDGTVTVIACDDCQDDQE
jgi:hypothetical protein